MHFDSVVFSGGGSRCFWQAGFWAELAEHADLRPTLVSAVSAGSAMACMAVARRWDQAVAHFVEATRNNARNFYPDRLLARDQRAFPHLDMYRNAIMTVMDTDAFAGFLRGPQVNVLLARPPRWLGARTGAVVAFTAYTMEKRLFAPVHPQMGRRLGFRPEVVRAQDCASREELAELILHSSCTPPFTPLFRRDGRVVLDGGAVDPVPTLALGDSPGETLVMLTARYAAERLPRRPGVTYVQPSREIPITKWDYANPDGIARAYELGRRDGRMFCQ